MHNISRRSFMGAAGAMAAMSTLGISTAFADEAPAEGFVPGGGSYAEGALDLGWTGTPETIAAAGNSTMPLAELNRRRRAYIDAQTEYTCADGTVIPVAYVRARALINTYGMGCGNYPADSSFQHMLVDFTEEQAEFFVNLPLGKAFTAYEASVATGHPVETCDEWLKQLAFQGYLKQFSDNGGEQFAHMAYFQGSVEFIDFRGISAAHRGDAPVDVNFPAGIAGANAEGKSYVYDLVIGGTHQFLSVPCFEDVVGDERILPFNDLRKILQSKKTVAIAPCLCRFRSATNAGDATLPTWEEFGTGEYSDYYSDALGMRVETCIVTDDEAENAILKGYARPCTNEEALALLELNMEDGFMPMTITSTGADTICSCHPGAGCGILKIWSALGDAVPMTPMGRQASAYDLVVDFDACLKCGLCAQRCPLDAITMDGEDGLPAVAGKCLKCGQCAHVCPQGARKLYARPEQEIYQLPADMIEDNNMKAAWRFEHGQIFV